MLDYVLMCRARATPLSKEGPEFTVGIIGIIDTIDSNPVRGIADNGFWSATFQQLMRLVVAAICPT